MIRARWNDVQIREDRPLVPFGEGEGREREREKEKKDNG